MPKQTAKAYLKKETAEKGKGDLKVNDGRMPLTDWFEENCWITKQHPEDIKNKDIQWIAVFAFPHFVQKGLNNSIHYLKGELTRDYRNNYVAYAAETREEALWQCALSAYKEEMDYSFRRQLPTEEFDKDMRVIELKGNIRKIEKEGKRIHNRYFKEILYNTII